VCGWPWKKVEARREEVYHLVLLSLRRVNAGKGGWYLTCVIRSDAAKQKRNFRLFLLFFVSSAYFLPIY